MSDPMLEVDPRDDELSDSSPVVVQITPGARDTVLGARAAENDPEHLALWIEVTGTNGERLHLRHLLSGDLRRQ